MKQHRPAGVVERGPSPGRAGRALARAVVAAVAAAAMAAAAAPVATAHVHYNSGAYRAPCHNEVQSPQRSLTARSTSLAAAPAGIATDSQNETALSFVRLQSAATGGPVEAGGRATVNYESPVANLPCQDHDISVEMTSSARLASDAPFFYGRNQTTALVETGRDLNDPRPVQIEAGELSLEDIQLSGGSGRADADVSISLLELRPQQPTRTLFDIVLSTPSQTGAALLAHSATNQALADEIAAAFSYDVTTDLYSLPFFGSSAFFFAAESLTDPYRNLFFSIETAVSVPEPLPLALLGLAASLLWIQRRWAPRVPGPASP